MQAYSSGSSPSCSWLLRGASLGSTLFSAGESSLSWLGELSSVASHIPENWRRSTGGGAEAESPTVTEGVTVSAGGLLLDSDAGQGASMHSECRWAGSACWISGSDTLTLEVRGEGRSMAAWTLGTGCSAWLSADDKSVLPSSSSAKRAEWSQSGWCWVTELKKLFWPNLRTPEMSHSFSSCMASAVLVMSMDETERSSLSSKSAGSGVVIVDSPEKPRIWRINELERPQKIVNRTKS